jgi:hypothetical protein
VCPYSEWTYAHCPPLRSRRLNASQLFASIFAKCTLHDCAVSSTNRLYVNRMCTHLRRHPFVPHDCWHTVRMKCRLSPSQPESCASRQQCVYQSRPPPPPLPSSVPFAAVLPFDAAISSICACATHGAHPMKCRYFEPSTPSTQPLLGTEYRTLFAFFYVCFPVQSKSCVDACMLYGRRRHQAWSRPTCTKLAKLVFCLYVTIFLNTAMHVEDIAKSRHHM